MQDLDTEIIVATARGTTTTKATAVSANVVVDERQMNALFLDVVSSYIIKIKTNGCYLGLLFSNYTGFSRCIAMPALTTE